MNILSFISYIIIMGFLLYSIYGLRIRSLLIRNQEFKCTDCTHCCKLLVRLDDADIKRIKSKKDFVVKKKGKNWLKQINGYCMFMNIKEGKSTCSIYNTRPRICRTFPNIKVLGIDCYDARCKAFKPLFGSRKNV